MDEDRNSCVGQEVLFHEIVETAPVPMIVSRFGGEVIYANRISASIPFSPFAIVSVLCVHLWNLTGCGCANASRATPSG